MKKRKSLLLLSIISACSLAVVGCNKNDESSPKVDDPDVDSSTSSSNQDSGSVDTTTSDTNKNVINRWLDTLKGDIKISYQVFERDHVVKSDGTTTAPDTDLINPSDEDSEDDTYIVYSGDNIFVTDKHYTSTKDYWPGDGDEFVANPDSVIESLFNVKYVEGQSDPALKNWNGYAAEAYLTNTNEVDYSYQPSFLENESNPLKEYVEDDFKLVDGDEHSFTFDSLDNLNQVCGVLVDTFFVDDPWTSINFKESDDKSSLTFTCALDEDKQDPDDGVIWCYDVFAKATIEKFNASEYPQPDIKKREETDASRKLDAAFKELTESSGYTIAHKEEDANNNNVKNYDVKYTQAKVTEDDKEKVVYNMVNTGSKSGFARFDVTQKAADSSKNVTYKRYYPFTYVIDDTQTPSVNVITVDKDDVSTEDTLDRSGYLPMYDRVSGAMFDYKDGTYTLNTTGMIGKYEYNRSNIFFLYLLEDKAAKYDEEYETVDDETNQIYYQDELQFTLDSTGEHLKTLSYKLKDIEDDSLVKSVTYEYKDINSTTITGFDFTLTLDPITD